MSSASIPTKKQPSETLKSVAVDFTNLLVTGDTISTINSVTSVIVGSDDVSDIIIGTATKDATSKKVVFDISGGTKDRSYHITVLVTTTEGDILEGDVLVVVKDVLWQLSMITALRVIINDLSSTPTYTDNRLMDVLTVAAFQVNTELDFTNNYTINIANRTIVPDPSDSSTLDDAFVNLSVLKAACLVDEGQFRTEALRSGVKARCGPAILETIDRIKGFSELLNSGPCAAYKEIKKQYQMGNTALLHAILSPFINKDFDARSLSTYDRTGEYYGY